MIRLPALQWLLVPSVLVWTCNFVSAFQSPSNNDWSRRIYYEYVTRGTSKSHIRTIAAATLVDIDESFPRYMNIASFEEWATACGVQRSEGFQLSILTNSNEEESQMEIGVMTTKDLPAQSPVLFVPSQMILSAIQAKQDLGSYCQAAEDLLLGDFGLQEEDRDRFYLFLKILVEHERGEESPWYPWLDALPRYFSNGVSMTQFCCSNCLPPLVGNLAIKERTRFKQFFKALELVPFLRKETRVYEKLAIWAHNIVYTRSFQDGNSGDFKITPMADMFNHDTLFEIQGQFDDKGNFCAFSVYDVPAGSPLRISYTSGDSTNPSFLFARYGFLDESSPATFCKIMIPNPSPELRVMGYDPSRMLFYKNTGEVSQEVWDVLLYQILENLNPDNQRALYEAQLRGDIETKRALHEHHYTETSKALMNHVETFLSQLENLSNIATSRDPSLHPRLPLILKHNEFVKQTFLNVRTNLA